MFLTLFLIDYSILRDDSLYVFSLIFVSHFNLLPFYFQRLKNVDPSAYFPLIEEEE